VSLYQTNHLTSSEQVNLVADGMFKGSPACQSTENHYKPGVSRGYRWRETPEPAPVASGVFIEWRSRDKKSIDYITFLCPKHGGPVKSIITRSSWRAGDIEYLPDVTPDDVMRVGVEQFIAQLVQMAKYERDAAKAGEEARILAIRRDGWKENRDNYHSRSQRHPALLTNVADDYFGRVFVVTTRADMTPNEAREYAHRLLAMADEAADLTAVAVKP
jgi:hypothetical protein